MRHRRAPRRLGSALRPARLGARPKTLLAAVQEAWPRSAGEGVAEEAQPVAERDEVITVACRSATWAQELDLLQAELLERLNRALSEWGREGAGGPVKAPSTQFVPYLQVFSRIVPGFPAALPGILM
jgi:predicted nucleic acid-binding Zn ribbon protein